MAECRRTDRLDPRVAACASRLAAAVESLRRHPGTEHPRRDPCCPRAPSQRRRRRFGDRPAHRQPVARLRPPLSHVHALVAATKAFGRLGRLRRAEQTAAQAEEITSEFGNLPPYQRQWLSPGLGPVALTARPTSTSRRAIRSIRPTDVARYLKHVARSGRLAKRSPCSKQRWEPRGSWRTTRLAVFASVGWRPSRQPSGNHRSAENSSMKPQQQ